MNNKLLEFKKHDFKNIMKVTYKNTFTWEDRKESGRIRIWD